MSRILICIAAALVVTVTGCGGGSLGTMPGGGGGGGSTPTLPPVSSAPALKTVLAARFGVVDFSIGAAIEPSSTRTLPDSALLIRNFSSITAENVMKPATLWPNAPGSTTLPASSPDFTQADELVNFAALNNQRLRGHTLLWHRSAPSWFFAGDTANPANYRATVQQNLRTYIFAVVQHFPNVYAWDVVNEVASDTRNGNPYRTDSPWYAAYSVGGMNGADYVADAFTFANQARSSIGKNSGNMKLMLNDYNTELPDKRANVMDIVAQLVAAGVPIDGVGHQFHLQVDSNPADVAAALTAVEAISSTLVNQVTELDVSIYADPGSCFAAATIPPCLADFGANPPQSVLSDQATLYRALFNTFNRPSVTSVTLWGVADNHTWLNAFPVTRTNRPLLFDTAGNPKWAFWTVVDPTIVVP